jgi:alpha-galactosidase
VVGDHFDEPVLLVKVAWGGKSLAVDFRPPSAGAIEYRGNPRSPRRSRTRHPRS